MNLLHSTGPSSAIRYDFQTAPMSIKQNSILLTISTLVLFYVQVTKLLVKGLEIDGGLNLRTVYTDSNHQMPTELPTAS